MEDKGEKLAQAIYELLEGFWRRMDLGVYDECTYDAFECMSDDIMGILEDEGF